MQALQQHSFRHKNQLVRATRHLGQCKPIRLAVHSSSSSSSSTAATIPTPELAKKRLLYDGVVFDMDGTLTQAHIDFTDMRRRTGIPVGDLFVAMESWEEPERIKNSMDVILEIEAEAAKSVQAKEGLIELLQLLRESDVQVALVTRNTTNSVAAFFQLTGEEWRSLFSEIRTREFKYVKPDKRLLLDVAQAWQLHPGRLLMVGDSFEDVEVGNAAGTATCLVAGGGNEAPGSNIGPPPGAIPTFSVNSLVQLRQFLVDTAPKSDVQGLETAAAAVAGASSSDGASDSSSLGLLGWSLRSSTESESDDEEASAPLWLDPSVPGNPPAGLDFVDFLVHSGALRVASTSFPRMGAAAGGLQACPEGGGHRVLHVGCADGALTKMLASKGLQVVGVDINVSAGLKRGLKCVAFQGAALSPGSLAAVAGATSEPADAVLIYTGAQAATQGFSSAECLSGAALQEYKQVLGPGSGCVCIEVPLSSGSTADSVQAQLDAGGFVVSSLDVLPAGGKETAAQRLRLVARPQKSPSKAQRFTP